MRDHLLAFAAGLIACAIIWALVGTAHADDVVQMSAPDYAALQAELQRLADENNALRAGCRRGWRTAQATR